MSTTASRRVEGKGQTCDFIEHVTYDNRNVRGGKLHTLRVRIHIDTHATQAWGKVERWSGTSWSTVAEVRGDALKTPLDLGYGPDARRVPAAFKADRDTLVQLAEEVL